MSPFFDDPASPVALCLVHLEDCLVSSTTLPLGEPHQHAPQQRFSQAPAMATVSCAFQQTQHLCFLVFHNEVAQTIAKSSTFAGQGGLISSRSCSSSFWPARQRFCMHGQPLTLVWGDREHHHELVCVLAVCGEYARVISSSLFFSSRFSLP